MPELPDVTIFAKNLDKIFAGKKVLRVKVVNGKRLKNTQKELTENLEGKKLKKIYRSGKEMRFEFTGDVLLGLHLMLTGDIFAFEEKNERKTTIVELHFEGGKNFVLTDRMGNANIYLNPVDKAGVDALEVDYKYLKSIFNRKAAIKNILLDQNIIRGIGNGYSDEILWETRISPYSSASAIPDEKVKELAKTIPRLLKEETEKIDKAYPGTINDEVKEFLKIHSTTKTKSPTGHIIKIDAKGLRKTYYTDEQVLYK